MGNDVPSIIGSLAIQGAAKSAALGMLIHIQWTNCEAWRQKKVHDWAERGERLIDASEGTQLVAEDAQR